MRGGLRIAGLAAALLVGASALGHVRLQHPSSGAELRWQAPSSVGVVISSAGSDDLPGGLHFPALRSAIAAWNADPGTVVQLVEDASPSQQARTDWQDDALHQILFDESNASGYFPAGSGIVALTPVWFGSSGRITDADVLFNGSGFGFTTSGEAGRFDVQDVGTHELGHFLGLDHSGWAGATMYPYVDPTVILHRSLSRDDLLGMRDAYPAGAFASISGTIRRASNDSVVAGAHVVARDANGRTTAGGLADRTGVFRLDGLDAGTYTVYATPLDFPVSAANLGPGHTVAVDFESTPLGTFPVSSGQSVAAGDLLVEPDVPISLGRNADRYPLRCVAGQTQTRQVRGAGLDAGCSLAASDPAIVVVPLSWLDNAVVFDATVPAGASAGHVDLTATNLAGERSVLPAALEITPANPGVTGVVPSAGSPAGGTPVTISGSWFAPGSRVVLGDVVYADGEIGGCTVVDAATITLVTAPTSGGLHDVVVIDSSGVEGRVADAFLVALTPQIASVFPEAGSALGGTSVVLQGSDLAPGCVVRIAGVQQSQVVFDDATRITFVTEAGVVGGPYVLEVENPGGSTATSSFSYVAGADPSIASVDPQQGKTAGGETIGIQGASFAPGSEVLFGADPDTGFGGSPAAAVAWIDASTLEVVTPAHGSGATSVLVRDPSTGQAAVVSNAFTFVSSGGGGGGCSVSPVDAPRSPLEPLAGGTWLLVLAWIAVWRARRASRAAAAGVRAQASGSS